MGALGARIFSVLLLSLAISACAGQGKYADRSPLEDNRALLSGATLFPAGEPLPELPTADLLAVSDDMRAFLDKHVPVRSISPQIKVQKILRALLEEDLNLHYSNLKTYTAAETFAAREGNCLSFTNLFIALAREAGVIASYQEVEVPPSWSAVGDTHYFNLHINVLVELPRKQQIVDFDVQNRSDQFLGKPVGDNVAEAQYHNNMAVYFLGQGDLQRAFLHSRRAIEMRPDAGYFWANLGTILRRADDLDNAERAYLVAIDLSNEPSALSNLARLYTQRGQPQLAAVYAERAESFRAQNPYYLYELAERAYLAGDYEETHRLLVSAIKKRRDEHEFYRLQGLAWAQRGDAEAAEKSFARAARYATDSGRVGLYEHKLQLLAHQD
jgi:tetratricopeptide (TPR) repeat protein